MFYKTTSMSKCLCKNIKRQNHAEGENIVESEISNNVGLHKTFAIFVISQKIFEVGLLNVSYFIYFAMLLKIQLYFRVVFPLISHCYNLIGIIYD